MALIPELLTQLAQMALVLLFAPLLTGFVRKLKARLLRRRGPSLFQPYRDLLRLLRKEVVLADNASWLFRAAPYLIFATTWVAAALVPTFATGLLYSWSADLIAIIALLGSARFLLALPLLAALAFAAKPVVRVLANQLFGLQFGSLRAGPVYPILTHLMFGFLGALAAVLVWRVTERRLRQ